MSNPIEQMMERLSTSGWDAFDETKLRDAQEAEAARDDALVKAEAAIVAAALANPAGDLFVAWLISKTLHRPPGVAELTATTAEAVAMAAKRREGQNQIVFMILAALATARGESSEENGL